MLKPKGRHTCVVCTGTACYIKGAPRWWTPLSGATASSRARPPRMASRGAHRALRGRLRTGAGGGHRRRRVRQASARRHTGADPEGIYDDHRRTAKMAQTYRDAQRPPSSHRCCVCVAAGCLSGRRPGVRRPQDAKWSNRACSTASPSRASAAWGCAARGRWSGAEPATDVAGSVLYRPKSPGRCDSTPWTASAAMPCRRLHPCPTDAAVLPAAAARWCWRIPASSIRSASKTTSPTTATSRW